MMMTKRTLLGAGLASVAPGALAQVNRPQTPVPPLPYDNEDVIVVGVAGARLAGTLSLPPNPAAGVLLLSVAGPNDRDLSFAGHRAFAVLADRLARAGIASLRLDDRGVGASQGDWATASYDMLAADALAAVAMLRADRRLNAGKVGVFGLSEGAAIAAMTAACSHPPLGFAVLASPPGVSGEAALRGQLERTLATSGITDAAAAPYRAAFASFVDLTRAAASDPARLDDLVQFLSGPGRALVPPARFYAGMRAPMLVIGGGLDVILPPEENHPPIRAMAPTAEFMVFDGVSHLLQPARTGLPQEYAQTDLTLDPRVIEAIERWIRDRAG